MKTNTTSDEQEFIIEITETLTRQIKVTAPNVQRAIERATHLYRCEEIILDADDLVSLELTDVTERK